MGRLLAALACLALLAAPAGALAFGGPIPPGQGGAGVALPGAPVRYVAVAVRGGTLVERVRRSDGALEASRFLAGRYGVPGVGWDGSTTGLSGDGNTLVLASLVRSYPPKRTRLLALEPSRMQVQWKRSLSGSYAVDAISPSGQWVYLLRYPDPKQQFRYEVRAYDAWHGRLLPEPVVDPRKPHEKLTGVAMTRATSAGGRWVYTLYQAQDGSPFVRALDTEGRTGARIDLPRLAGDLSGVRLALGGGRLLVRTGAASQAVIDTTTLRVSAPAAPRPPATDPAPADGGAPLWVLALLPLGALAILVQRRRRLRS
jgi:hypothetical protein